VLLAAAGMAAAPAAAQTPNWKACPGKAAAAEIEACTRIIDLGNRLSAQHRSIAYSNRGTAYLGKGELDIAIADYTEAIRLDPKTAILHLNRGTAYSAKFEYDRGIRDLDEAIRLNPKLAGAYNIRGAAHASNGDSDRAMRDLDETIRLDPKQATAYASRGVVYSQKHDYDRAIRDFDEGIRLDSKNAVLYGNRGHSYIMKGDHDRAIADLNEAIRLDPKDAILYSDRSAAFREKGDLERAIADADQAVRLDPKLTKAHTTRGLAHEKKGDRERARVDFTAALGLPIRRALDKSAQDTARQRIAVMTEGERVRPSPSPATETATATAALSPPAPPTPAPAPATATAAPGRRVALVIGNGAYQHATRLPNPANDAGDMTLTLRRLGFDVVEGRDLDRRGMDDKLREFGRKLDRADLALFFYAGHGIQVGGKNYLVPIDAKLERAGDLNLDAVDVGFVLAQMETEKRVNLIFLDACRDNPLARSFARSLGTRSTAVGQGLATIQSAIGTMIAYATQPDAVALDGDGRNSPFTTALLKHLNTPGLEIGALMRRVRADVIAATREKQVPWDHSSLTGDVILAR
jgi:tetratricopeptide (TPR) repeat protein